MSREVDAGSRHEASAALCGREESWRGVSLLWGTGLSLFPLPTSPLGLSWLPPSARFVVHQGPLSSLVSCLFTVRLFQRDGTFLSNVQQDRNRRVCAMQCNAHSQNLHLRSLQCLPKHEDKQQRNAPTVHADWRKLRDVKVLQEHAMIRVADLVPFHWLLGAFQLGPHLRSNRRLNATSLHDVELH